MVICLCIGLAASIAQPVIYSTQNSKAIKYFEEAQLNIALKPDVAIEKLKKAIEKDNNFIEAHAFLGDLLADDAQYAKAIDEYKECFLINPNFMPDYYFYAGSLELKLGRYADAKGHLQQYVSSKSSNHKKNDEAELKIKCCDFALNAMQHPVHFNPVNIGPEINSQYDEYFPSITADDQTFLFTRRLPMTNRDPRMGNSFQEDFYYSNKENGKWTQSRSIGTNINTQANEGAPCLSVDGQFLFFVVCPEIDGYGLDRRGYGSCDIFVAQKTATGWSKPHNLGPPVNSKNWESQPSFSSDGKTLYFVRAVLTGNGVGQGDIYTSEVDDKGKWSNPVKLSNKINTPYNEESVFIHPDNQTLYFASNGHVGMGGTDIYMSKRQPDGEWGDPVNLGYPINTFNNENSLLVDSKGKLAYFASNRAGGYGGQDIYTFEVDSQFRPENVTYFKGKVYDSRTKKPLEASIELIDLATSKTAITSSSNPMNGEFLVCLPANKNYALNVSRTGYLFYSENFALKEVKDISKPFLMDVPLQPIDTGLTVKLNNIFFETNKYDLKEESKTELQKLITFLTTNPTLKIELGGHTDNVGDKKANNVLSQNRAKSVYDYLIGNGISQERLSFRGYGDSKPVKPNDTPENRQMNRRTEFKVTSK